MSDLAVRVCVWCVCKPVELINSPSGFDGGRRGDVEMVLLYYRTEEERDKQWVARVYACVRTVLVEGGESRRFGGSGTEGMESASVTLGKLLRLAKPL